MPFDSDHIFYYVSHSLSHPQNKQRNGRTCPSCAAPSLNASKLIQAIGAPHAMLENVAATSATDMT